MNKQWVKRCVCWGLLMSTLAQAQIDRIVIEWDGYSGRTTVEWTFSAREDATVYSAQA